MATAVMPKTAPRPAAKPAPEVEKRGKIDNQRTEDMARFAMVLMMPAVLGALVIAIAFFLTPAVQ